MPHFLARIVLALLALGGLLASLPACPGEGEGEGEDVPAEAKENAVVIS